eukprot:UC4_evm4s1059
MLALLSFLHLSSALPCTVFVSITGDDGNTGSSPTSALRSIEAARSRARTLRHNGVCHFVTVKLGNGTFYVQHPPLTLSAEDSNTSWMGDISTTISAGSKVPTSCWQNHGGSLFSCRFDASSPKNRVLYGGDGERLQQARYPDFVPNNPRMGGWLILSSSEFYGNGTFRVGIAEPLPAYLTQFSASLKALLFPARSWISLVEVTCRPLESINGIQYFELRCPNPSSQCSNTSNSASILPGIRLYFYGLRQAISRPGEWAWENNTLWLKTLERFPSIVVPRSTAVIRVTGDISAPRRCNFSRLVSGRSPGTSIKQIAGISVSDCAASCCNTTGCMAFEHNPSTCYIFDRPYEDGFINDTKAQSFLSDLIDPPKYVNGVRNLFFSSLIFEATDFEAVGYQEGFSETDISPGLPRDAALVVSAATNITVSDCAFLQLAGGAIHVSNGSRNINVVASIFDHLGQSAVSFDGSNEKQPSHSSVESCKITNIGEILAASGGIVGSTVSFSNFTSNSIINTSRWGIHIRSFPGDTSISNLVSSNHLENVGFSSLQSIYTQLALTTKDLGGLSFIGNGHTGSVIENNCVKNIFGLDTDPRGNFLDRYLDNWSSNFTIKGNILNGNVLGGVFIHGGSNNVIDNNIIVNSDNSSMPPPGSYGHCDASQGVLFGRMMSSGIPVNPPQNNTFSHNIVVIPETLEHAAPIADVGGNFSLFSGGTTVIDVNIYWQNPGKYGFLSSSSRTPFPLSQKRGFGTWASWRSSGWDQRSIVEDPGFHDINTGNFTLIEGSPAIKLGFKPLPLPIC